MLRILVGSLAARCASWPLWTRRTVTSLLVACLAGFAGDSAHRAVLCFPFDCGRPLLPGFMVGMLGSDRTGVHILRQFKEGCYGRRISYFLREGGTSGSSGPYSALRFLIRTVDTCGASVYKAFWKYFSHFYLKRWIADPEVDSRLLVLPVFSVMLGSTVAGG